MRTVGLGDALLAGKLATTVRVDRVRLRILVVPRPSAGGELEARLQRAVAARLSELGVDDPQIVVERRDALARSPGGKLPLVVAERA